MPWYIWPRCGLSVIASCPAPLQSVAIVGVAIIRAQDAAQHGSVDALRHRRSDRSVAADLQDHTAVELDALREHRNDCHHLAEQLLGGGA